MTAGQAQGGDKAAIVTVAVPGEPGDEIALRLRELGWRVRRARSPSEVDWTASDAVVIAGGAPGGGADRLTKLAQERGRASGRPLVTVIEPSADRRLASLEAGADDAAGPEVGAAEIAARLQALLRRSRAERERSPLTGLPGNAQLERALRERLGRGRTPAILMLDIDNFKAFNDRYGHWRGDRVIQMLGHIARETAARDPDALVTHVGGDDFCIVTTPQLVDQIARQCQEQFDSQARQQYDGSDRRRGYVTTRSRTGRRRQFKLMTLTLAAATAEAEDMQHIGQFFQVLAELKEYAKDQPGSTYVRDRRRDHGWGQP